MSAFYKKPLVIGVSQVRFPSETGSLEDVLVAVGHNSGNVIFTHALQSVIAGATRSNFSPTDQDFQTHDCIVIAAANWINNYEDYGWLADRVERTNLPVVMVGIGAQSDLSKGVPALSEGTRRLLEVVSERSASIAARGSFTCEVLNHYNFKNVTPTGCPSLLLAGPGGPSIRQPASLERVVLHGTRHGFGECDALQKFIYNQALTRDCELLLQSEVADIHLMSGHKQDHAIIEKAALSLKAAFGIDDLSTIGEYLRKRGIFVCDYASWIEKMRKRDLCLGTRIHGTVASIIAGTPALLIAHDSRTVELAETLNIPFVPGTEIPLDRALDFAKYADKAMALELATGFEAYRDQFISFFHQNRLAVAPWLCNTLS